MQHGIMLRNILAISLALQSFDVAEAISLAKRDAPAVVKFDIGRRNVTNPVARDNARRKKRSNTVNETLDNAVSYSHGPAKASREMHWLKTNYPFRKQCIIAM